MNKEAKVIISDIESKEKILEGMKKVTDPIKKSMGRKGEYTSFYPQEGFLVTANDGFTISKYVTPLEDVIENIGADIVMNAGQEVDLLAGDSTSLGEVSTYNFSKVAHELVKDGANRHYVYNILERIKKDFVNHLTLISDTDKTLEKLQGVAITSCKNEELGMLIGKAVYESGEFGNVIPRRESKKGYALEDVPGYYLRASFVSDRYFENAQRISKFNDGILMLYNDKIDDPRQVYPIAQMINTQKLIGEPIILICNGIVPTALEIIKANFQNAGHLVYVIELNQPDKIASQVMEDIGVLTKTPVLGRENGLPVLTNRELMKDFKTNPMDYLGEHQGIVVKKDSTMILFDNLPEEHQKQLDQHIKNLENKFDEIKSKSQEKDKHELDELSARITKMKSSLKILKFGEDSQNLLNTLEFQIEDAINTARLAMKSGTIVGGGLALIDFCELYGNHYYQNEFEKETADMYKNLLEVFTRPHFYILENSGFGDEDIKEIFERALDNEGLDIMNYGFTEFINYKENFILDSREGIELAITKAISSAQQFILTNHFVVNAKDLYKPYLSGVKDND